MEKQNNEDLYDEIRKFTNLATRYIRNSKETKEKSELTHSQSIVLIFIHNNLKDGKPVYQKDIERQFMIRRSTATEILKKLEKLCYIERKPSVLDARLKDLSLTEKSKKLLSCADKKLKSVSEVIGKDITDEEIKILKNVLLKMQTNLLKELKNEENS